MDNITAHGVCYDLEETPYRYEWRGITYCFSSIPHLNKFKREVRKRELWLNDSLSRRFGVTVSLELVADIQLYRQVETRGFYILTNDGAEYKEPIHIIITPNLLAIGIVSDDVEFDTMWGVNNG